MANPSGSTVAPTVTQGRLLPALKSFKNSASVTLPGHSSRACTQDNATWLRSLHGFCKASSRHDNLALPNFDVACPQAAAGFGRQSRYDFFTKPTLNKQGRLGLWSIRIGAKIEL